MDQVKSGEKRGEARAEAILEAAQALLRAGGFPALTMAAVADKARASKQTIYRHFSDRTGLLQSLVNWKLTKIVAKVPAAPAEEGVREGLVRLARWYMAEGTTPDVLSLYRVLAAGAGSADPEMARVFSANVEAALVAPVAAFLTKHAEVGHIWLPCTPEQIAETFLGAVSCKLWTEALIAPDASDLSERIEAQIQRAVNLTLAALTSPAARSGSG